MGSKRYIRAPMWYYEECYHQGYINSGTKDEVEGAKISKLE